MLYLLSVCRHPCNLFRKLTLKMRCKHPQYLNLMLSRSINCFKINMFEMYLKSQSSIHTFLCFAFKLLICSLNWSFCLDCLFFRDRWKETCLVSILKIPLHLTFGFFLLIIEMHLNDRLQLMFYVSPRWGDRSTQTFHAHTKSCPWDAKVCHYSPSTRQIFFNTLYIHVCSCATSC